MPIRYLHNKERESTDVMMERAKGLNDKVAKTSGVPTWSLPAVRDTLPLGSYTAVFLGNVEKALFTYSAAGGGNGYSDVLTNYQGQIADARINLPSGQMSDAQTALNSLTAHVITNVNSGNVIENQVNAVLPGLVRIRMSP